MSRGRPVAATLTAELVETQWCAYVSVHRNTIGGSSRRLHTHPAGPAGPVNHQEAR